MSISEGLPHLMTAVESLAAGTHSSLTAEDIALVSKLMQFPHDKIFPVLDICRFLVLDAAFNAALIPLIGPQFDGACIHSTLLLCEE